MLDFKITGGRIIDGTGNPWFTADVGIKDGKIVAIGNLKNAEARTTIVAKMRVPYRDERNPFPWLVVAPGFIDIHSHADYTILAGIQADSFVRQGVTTVVMGNCGFSLAPVSERNIKYVVHQLRHKEGIHSNEVEWRSFQDLVTFLRTIPLLTNVLSFVGHNTLRTAVMGVESRPATHEELLQMQQLLEEALDAGALGLSAGLEFPPGRAADLNEIVSLCRVVGRYNGIYAPHIRNRDQFYVPSVHEAIEVAKETAVRLQIAHLNCRANTGAPYRAWERVVSMVENARDVDGLDIGSDCIPYAWGPGSYIGILPDWFTTELSRDPQAAFSMLKDRATLAQLWRDSDRYWRFIHRGEWERVKLASSKSHPELIGATFSEIAERFGTTPWEAFLQILRDEGEDVFGLHLYGRLFDDKHVVDLVTHPLFCLSSDAAPVSLTGHLAHAFVNQAGFGWTARVLGYFVRELGVMRLEEAVRKMTSFPAERIGLHDRGLIREGFWADLVLFDPVEIADTTSPDDPVGYPRGIAYVFVNGELVVAEGRLTGQAPGVVLRPKL